MGELAARLWVSASPPFYRIGAFMDYKSALGINPQTGANEVGGETLFEYVNMRLSAAGLPVFGKEDDYPIVELAKPLLENYREFSKLSAEYYCPPDSRIMNYLENYLSDVCDPREPFPSLPHKTFVLDRFGTARTLSLPPDSDKHENPLVSSYRVRQGILNNPRSDRRTTAGVFHVAEGGLPVPADKKSVPKRVFKNLWARAFSAPDEMLELPFTSTQERKAKTWVSIYLRPTVCPKIPNGESEKTMEIRFFAPGALVCNLDFVESIFGNAGNPFLQKNDAAEYLDSWTGHTGCIVLAPHLTSLKKKELGLPNISEATERQKRDGMCWEDPDELYNDGKPFKITARGSEGVIVTLIADNYFGYSKKEIKTQISYSANLYGQCEEEHSGGALAFSSRDLGEDFYSTSYAPNNKSSFARLVEILADTIEVHPDGWARDKNYPDIIYVDEKAYYSLKTQTVTWQKDGVEKSIRLTPYTTYISPAGYKVEMSRPHESRRWRLVGTTEEGVYCHKPATVSGGGKSEMSKDISDAIIHGPSMIADFKRDIEFVSEIINKNYGNRYRDPNSPNNKGPLSRPILDSRRTMGSVVKLLTPSDEYSDEYNKWLSSIPFYIREFVLTVKRHYRPEWGKNWQDKFSVDTINGTGGNTLKYKNAPVLTSYLRIGFTEDGSWRTFSLRKDFAPSIKLQMEDDITTSVVVPESAVEYLPENLASRGASVKFTNNCEYRLFQRPDEAIVRGYDKRAEADMSQKGMFFSNYEPLDRRQVGEMAADVLRFDRFTPPMRKNLSDFLEETKPEYVVSSANPRLIDGKPSKNVRYLQNRDDIVNRRKYYISDIGSRLARGIAPGKDVPHPVNAVISGRRNNPASEGIRALAVHGPLHYLELPELFMEYIASMTGKSPSTVGAGLEGAMTKGPFNALCAVTDLNAALVSFALTRYDGWLSSAGYIGVKYRVDHDISLLIPEIWARMRPNELDVQNLIKVGMLERCKDFEYGGKKVLASRLGWRITEDFVIRYFGRIFSNPASIFTADMLRPELQDMDAFADGMDNMVGAHRRAAEMYFEDGSIEGACPPLKALLYIMRDGSYEGKTLDDPSLRQMFTRESILKSEWYAERLMNRQQIEINLLQSAIRRLSSSENKDAATAAKIAELQAKLKTVKGINYLKSIYGTLGADSIFGG